MTQIYRHYSADGTLLYVGIAQNASWRQAAHAMRSGWFRDVRTITVSAPYRSRAAALVAEAEAIRTELPRYNQVHHPDPIAPPAMAGKALLKRLDAARRKVVAAGTEADGESFAERTAAALARLRAWGKEEH